MVFLIFITDEEEKVKEKNMAPCSYIWQMAKEKFSPEIKPSDIEEKRETKKK